MKRIANNDISDKSDGQPEEKSIRITKKYDSTGTQSADSGTDDIPATHLDIDDVSRSNQSHFSQRLESGHHRSNDGSNESKSPAISGLQCAEGGENSFHRDSEPDNSTGNVDERAKVADQSIEIALGSPRDCGDDHFSSVEATPIDRPRSPKDKCSNFESSEQSSLNSKNNPEKFPQNMVPPVSHIDEDTITSQTKSDILNEQYPLTDTMPDPQIEETSSVKSCNSSELEPISPITLSPHSDRTSVASDDILKILSYQDLLDKSKDSDCSDSEESYVSPARNSSATSGEDSPAETVNHTESDSNKEPENVSADEHLRKSLKEGRGGEISQKVPNRFRHISHSLASNTDYFIEDSSSEEEAGDIASKVRIIDSGTEKTNTEMKSINATSPSNAECSIEEISSEEEIPEIDGKGKKHEGYRVIPSKKLMERRRFPIPPTPIRLVPLPTNMAYKMPNPQSEFVLVDMKTGKISGSKVSQKSQSATASTSSNFLQSEVVGPPGNPPSPKGEKFGESVVCALTKNHFLNESWIKGKHELLVLCNWVPKDLNVRHSKSEKSTIYPWAISCIDQKKFFCWPCLLLTEHNYGPDHSSPWSCSMNEVVTDRETHEQSKYHIMATTILLDWRKLKERDGSMNINFSLTTFEGINQKGAHPKGFCILEELLSNDYRSGTWTDADKKSILTQEKPPALTDDENSIKWLSHCPVLDQTFCWPCLLFGEEKQVLGKWSDHSYSPQHVVACLQLEVKVAELKFLPKNPMAKRNRRLLFNLIKTVNNLVKLDYKDFTVYECIDFLKLICASDDYLKDALYMKSETSVDFLCPETISDYVKDITESFVSSTMEHIKGELKHCLWVCMILEAVQIEGRTLPAVIIQYVSENGMVNKRFLKLIQTIGGGGSTDRLDCYLQASHIFVTISAILHQYDCGLKLLAWTCNGASMDVKTFNILSNLMKSAFTLANFIPSPEIGFNFLIELLTLNSSETAFFFNNIVHLYKFARRIDQKNKKMLSSFERKYYKGSNDFLKFDIFGFITHVRFGFSSYLYQLQEASSRISVLPDHKELLFYLSDELLNFLLRVETSYHLIWFSSICRIVRKLELPALSTTLQWCFKSLRRQVASSFNLDNRPFLPMFESMDQQAKWRGLTYSLEGAAEMIQSGEKERKEVLKFLRTWSDGFLTAVNLNANIIAIVNKSKIAGQQSELDSLKRTNVTYQEYLRNFNYHSTRPSSFSHEINYICDVSILSKKLEKPQDLLVEILKLKLNDRLPEVIKYLSFQLTIPLPSNGSIEKLITTKLHPPNGRIPHSLIPLDAYLFLKINRVKNEKEVNFFNDVMGDIVKKDPRRGEYFDF